MPLTSGNNRYKFNNLSLTTITFSALNLPPPPILNQIRPVSLPIDERGSVAAKALTISTIQKPPAANGEQEVSV